MSMQTLRNYKDTVFRMLYRDKKELLKLYNAVNHSNYSNPDELEIATLENAIYVGMKNDIAFLIDSTLNLYEQQSTFNPNMPLRNLFYVAKEYEKLIIGESLYSSKLIRLPFPKFVVFYNGSAKQPERLELKLSDAYQLSDDYKHPIPEPELELKVLVLNINSGNNIELLNTCQTLKEYMQYVECVRTYIKVMPRDEAVDHAIDECIKNNILRDFLLKNKAEVKSMSIFEYDEEKEMALYRKAEYEKAYEELSVTLSKELSEKLSLEISEKLHAEISEKLHAEISEKLHAEISEKLHAEISEKLHAEYSADALKNLVSTLKTVLPDFQTVYKAVINNEIYADLTEDEIRKYY